jgi:pectate lyase
MPIADRKTRTGFALLAVTALLWVLAALFKLSVTPFFHVVLIKRVGMIPVLGFMLVAPLIAAALGFSLRRRAPSRGAGLSLIVPGVFFLALFLVIIAYPLLRSRFEPATPANPRTPRPVPPQTGLPAFPGAEGFGTRTPAGRDGRVLEVTTLADRGPGSLREALEQPGPRIVVFRVAGTIELEDFLYVNHPFLTVAGQTAPAGGICLKNAGLTIMTHDVLIQHLRIRPGIEGNITPEHNDAVAILGRHGEIEGASHVVLDHLSASWGEDETISVWYGAHDITISNCIISEALNRARHEKRTHSAGLLIGDGAYHVSVHHCLLAHNDFRNPLISSGGTHDFVNNVIYNWGVLPAEIVDPDANTFLNFVGNYFRPGPSSRTDCFEILINPRGDYGVAKPKFFVQGNLGPHRPSEETSDWALVGYGFSDREPAPEAFRSLDPFDVHPVAATGADEAFQQVLAGAGATLPRRDAVDLRIVAEVRSGGGRTIDSPEEVGGYPDLTTAAPSMDADRGKGSEE